MHHCSSFANPSTPAQFSSIPVLRTDTAGLRMANLNSPWLGYNDVKPWIGGDWPSSSHCPVLLTFRVSARFCAVFNDPQDDGIGATKVVKDAHAPMRIKWLSRESVHGHRANGTRKPGTKELNRAISVSMTNVDAPRGLSGLLSFLAATRISNHKLVSALKPVDFQSCINCL